MLELFNLLPEGWRKPLIHQQENLRAIGEQIDSTQTIPVKEKIFAAFPDRPEDVRIVILGQDPYPNRHHATGLAFSVPQNTEPLPPSLRNIFSEIQSDLGIDNTSGDLESWKEQGVFLLNRVLTTRDGLSLAHQGIGWEAFTEEVIRIVAIYDPIAILWGKKAGECAHYFSEHRVISSTHPSPLSAYRGFFGSKPFSRANTLLQASGNEPLRWSTHA